MRVNIRAELDEARKFMTELRRVEINRAAANALNVLGREVRNASIEEIADIRRVRPSFIRSRVFLERASQWALAVAVTVQSGAISLKEFGAKQGPLGVTVNVTGENKILPEAFGPGRSARRRWPWRGPVLGGHVFVRETPNRLPIRKLFGPTLPSGFVREVVQENLRKLYEKRWPQILGEKLNDQLAKLRAKTRR